MSAHKQIMLAVSGVLGEILTHNGTNTRQYAWRFGRHNMQKPDYKPPAYVWVPTVDEYREDIIGSTVQECTDGDSQADVVWQWLYRYDIHCWGPDSQDSADINDTETMVSNVCAAIHAYMSGTSVIEPASVEWVSQQDGFDARMGSIGQRAIIRGMGFRVNQTDLVQDLVTVLTASTQVIGTFGVQNASALLPAYVSEGAVFIQDTSGSLVAGMPHHPTSSR